MALTLLDVFDAFESVQVCVAYELDGDIIDTLPAGSDQIGRVRPIYERLAGWQESTVMARDAGQLPEQARDYLRFIERHVGVPISLVGVGPGRDQIVTFSESAEPLASGARA
jgi:adenylosuccinate synthase